MTTIIEKNDTQKKRSKLFFAPILRKEKHAGQEEETTKSSTLDRSRCRSFEMMNPVHYEWICFMRVRRELRKVFFLFNLELRGETEQRRRESLLMAEKWLPTDVWTD